MNYKLKHAVKGFKPLRLSIVFKMLVDSIYIHLRVMTKCSNIFMI